MLPPSLTGSCLDRDVVRIKYIFGVDSERNIDIRRLTALL